jgi:hypothetical protein
VAESCFCSRRYNMFRPRSNSVKMLVAIAASVLFVGIVATELPELLSLTDNTSNDFAFRKAGPAECTSILNTANHCPIPLHMKDSEYSTDIRCTAALEDATPPSSDLCLLHSVLRR